MCPNIVRTRQLHTMPCHMMASVDLRTETLHLVVCLDACGDCSVLSGPATSRAQGPFYSAIYKIHLLDNKPEMEF